MIICKHVQINERREKTTQNIPMENDVWKPKNKMDYDKVCKFNRKL